MKRLSFLMLGMFTLGSSSFMIAGLLPKIGQTIGQPISITSQGITAFSLTYLFSAPFFSVAFANRSAKRTLQLALAIFLIGNLITLSSESLIQFIVGRILTGLGAGIFNPLCVSVAMQLGQEKAKGKILSLIWGANTAGVVVGVPFGIYLSSKMSWQYSISYVFILGLITLVGFSLQKMKVDLTTSSSWKERLRVLADKDILAVIGITCATSVASLGLYSYVSALLAGAPHSLAASLFFWGLGGLVGSSLVGFFVDRTGNPRSIMVFILTGLMLAILTIPFFKDLPYLGLLSFFMWGAFGWSTPTPQQHALFGLRGEQKAILSALNSSAIGMGSSLGTALGGVAIASGFRVIHLPFLAATLLAGVVLWQLMLVKKYQVGHCS